MLTMPGADAEITATYNDVTGMETIDLQDEIVIYPNPAAEAVFIVFPEAKYNTLVLINMLGEKVLMKKIDASMDQVNLDLSGFVTGAYIVSLQNGEGIVRGMLVIE